MWKPIRRPDIKASGFRKTATPTIQWFAEVYLASKPSFLGFSGLKVQFCSTLLALLAGYCKCNDTLFSVCLNTNQWRPQLLKDLSTRLDWIVAAIESLSNIVVLSRGCLVHPGPPPPLIPFPCSPAAPRRHETQGKAAVVRRLEGKARGCCRKRRRRNWRGEYFEATDRRWFSLTTMTLPGLARVSCLAF